MKKTILIIVGIIVIAGLVIGALFLFNPPAKKAAVPKTTATSSTDNSTSTISGAVINTATSPTLGQYLTDSDGNTLYTYGSDTSGISNCTGGCLASWPAYQDSGATTGLPTNVGTITRSDDGTVQYTYKGLPLYTFVGDSKGKVTGNGLSGFQVAKP